MIKPDEEDQHQDQEPFVCPVCNKRYKSGKALGGHKRTRNLPPKKNKTVKTVMKPSNKRKGIDFADEENKVREAEDEPICPLCEKSFPSKKSLFGHMRAHPDRGWRGIQPPPHQPAPVRSASSSISTRDHMINMVDEFSSDTPKRRVLMLSSDSPETSPSDLDLAKYMKQGNWSVTAKRGSRKSCSSSPSSSTASNFTDIPGMESSMKEAVIDLMLLGHHKPRSSLLSTLHNIENKNKNRRKKMKLVDREQEAEGTMLTTSKAKVGCGLYICSDCKMSFPSYQALGGHRSSHRKKNIKINNHLSGLDGDDDDDSLRSSDEKAATDDKDNDGGDRSSAQKGGIKIVLDFDLNELPPSED